MKKCIFICYHAVLEFSAMDESILGHIPRSKNVADLMSKTINGSKTQNLVGTILYDMYGNN